MSLTEKEHRKERSPSKEKVSSYYKLVAFDMDGTLVNVGGEQESGGKVGVGLWQVMFDSLKIPDLYRLLKLGFTTKEFSYMDWSDEACRILKENHFTEEMFSEIISRQPFMSGAKEALVKFRERDIKTVMITGGFSDLATRVQKELGVDETIAHCDLKFGADGKLESWKLIPCDYEDKPERLKELLAKYKIDSSKCVYVGDGINDIPVFQSLGNGLSVAFNSSSEKVKEEVEKMQGIVVSGKNLLEVVKAIDKRAGEIEKLSINSITP